MSRQLPDLIDPLQIAEKGQVFSGQVAISRMQRIKDSLSNDQGCLEVALRFGKDESGQRYVKGEIHGELQLFCQRCMMPMAWPLDAGFSLALLRSEAQIESMADIYEPFIVPPEKVKLVELLEDEIILQLPLVPKHELDQCVNGPMIQRSASQAIASAGDNQPGDDVKPGQSASEPVKPNPFSVLADLKKPKQ